MIYDCIIAGAGPAGTFCAYLLQKSGYSCLVLERLQAYGEKVCGGWMPNVALQTLKAAGIDIDQMSQSIGIRTKSCLTVKGSESSLYTYPEGIYGLGTTRNELDGFLAEQATRAGAKIYFGETVDQFQKIDGLYNINGYRGRTFVAAAGARGLIHNKLDIYQDQSFGISAQIRGKGKLCPSQVYFWYEDKERLEYFWAIPIGESLWNIGRWFRHPAAGMRKRFDNGLETYIRSQFEYFEYILPPRGAFLGNVDLTRELPYGCFSAGDFAGVNNEETGEGLSFALKSAEQTAQSVRKVLMREKYERMEFICEQGQNLVFLCDQIQYFTVTDMEKKALSALLDGESEEAARKLGGIDEKGWSRLLEKIEKREEVLPVDVKTKTVRLTFNISNCCNMDCKYCYAQGGSYHSTENRMTAETAKKALDLFYTKYTKVSSIKFIGGEPALNLDVAEYICRYHQEKMERGEIQKLPEFIFVTNGTIVNDQMIRLANIYGVKIGFSLDGPDFVNDQVRVMKNGRPSTSIVRENIKRLQEATGGREPYSVNAVYTELEAEDKISIAEIVRYVYTELKIPSVHMIPVDVGEDSPYYLSNDHAFVEAVDELLEEWRQTGNSYFFNNLRGIMRKIEMRLYSPEYVCDAGFGLFSVSADGKVYPCHLFTDLENFCFGTVDENIFEGKAYQKLSRELESYERRKEEPCRSCFANRLCIGCLGANYFRTGDKFTPAPFICGMFQKVVRRVLAEYAIQGRNGMTDDTH